MSDLINTGMSALKLSWDTPYRILASLLSVGCACVLWGWVDASSPLHAVGQIGAYLGLHQATDVSGEVSAWLSARKDAVSPVASFLLLAGVALNVGDGTGRNSIPGPWRGAPTGLLALAIIWEVDPGTIPGVLIWAAVALVGTLVLSCFNRNGGKVRDWLGSTVINLAASAAFVLILPLWMVSRTSPKAPQS